MAPDDPEPRRNPYPGLRSFELGEEDFFFGRSRHVDHILERLGAARFLAVAGSSGSGKSSLVRCGLAAALRRGRLEDAAEWRIAFCRPQENPIGHLMRALDAAGITPTAGAGESDAESDAELRGAALDSTSALDAAGGLVERARRALPRGARLLIVVDQFEELFRFRHNLQIENADWAAVAFVRLLLQAIRQREVPIYVVITLRAEYLGHCTEFPGLGEAINGGHYLVPRMSAEERREAIAGPAAAVGVEIAPRLVKRLIDEVGDDPDQLPILQHALMRAWDEHAAGTAAGEPIDLRHYETIGTMAQALSLHAEEAWHELADARQREICGALFKAITEKDVEGHGIRRPLRLADAAALAGASEDELRQVVEVFRRPGRSFLTPAVPAALSADAVLDLSHESLMRIWGRLIDWFGEEARWAQTYRELAVDSRRYHSGEGGLYRDPQLQLALNWRQEAQPFETWARRYDPAFERAMIFLDYSEKDRAERIALRERLRRRQIRLLQWGVGILAVACLVALYNFFAASTAQEEAEVARDVAHEERQQAVEAHQQADFARQQAERARRRAEQLTERSVRLNKRLMQQQQATASARRRVASLSEQVASEEVERARLDITTAAQAMIMQSLLPTHEPPLAALLAVAAWRTLAEHGLHARDPDLHEALWAALQRLAPEESVLAHHDGARVVVLAADGATVFSAGADRRVTATVLFGAAAGLAEPVDRPKNDVAALAADPGGGWLAAGTATGSVLLWDLSGQKDGSKNRSRKLVECRKRDDCAVVRALAASPDGSSLAGADERGGLRLWDPATGSMTGSLTSSPQPVRMLAWSADGRTLAGATADGLRLWDLDRPQAAPGTRRAGEDFHTVAFGEHGGRWLAAGHADGTVLLWRPNGMPEELGAAHQGRVSALALGGARLVSAGAEGTVKLWDLDRLDTQPIVLRDHLMPVMSVVLSSDGSRLVSADGETVRAVPTETTALVRELCRRLPRRQLTLGEHQEHLPGLEHRDEDPCPPEPGPPADGSAAGAA